MLKKRIAGIIGITMLISSIILVLYFKTGDKKEKVKTLPEFYSANKLVADSVLNTLSIDEKISQLLCYTPNPIISQDSIFYFIKQNNIGTVRFCADSITQFIHLSRQLHDSVKFPPFTCLYSTSGSIPFTGELPEFPHLPALRAVKDDSLLTEYYRMVAVQHRLLNSTISFLPFLQDGLFYKKALHYETTFDELFLKHLKSLHQQKVLSGIYGFENYYWLSKDSIRNREIIHFLQKAINNGLCCISIEKDSLMHDSVAIQLVNLLSKELHFDGLIISNLIDTRGDLSTAVKNTLISGADILSVGKDITAVHGIIREWTENDSDVLDLINRKVGKILLAKQYTELSDEKEDRLTKNEITDSLNCRNYYLLNDHLLRNSLTLLNNHKAMLPFTGLDERKFCIYTVGENNLKEFHEQFQCYAPTAQKRVKTKNSIVGRAFSVSARYNSVIVVLNNLPPDSVNKGFLIESIDNIRRKTDLVLINFGSPEILEYINDSITVVQVYRNSETEQKYAAQLLFGGIKAGGKLPFTINRHYKKNLGDTTAVTRVRYCLPEEAGLNSHYLEKIDSIVYNAIDKCAMPGCQVMAIRKGNVVFQKSYGFLTYSKQNEVNDNTLYDVASVSKIAGTTMAAMKMYNDSLLDLDKPLEEYFNDTRIEYTRIKPDTIIKIDTLLPREIKNIEKFTKKKDTIHINDSIIVAYDTIIYKLTPKNNIFRVTPRELLLHQSGIMPSLPILPLYLWKINPNKNNFRITANRFYQIADSLTAVADSEPKLSDFAKILAGIKDSLKYEGTVNDSAKIKSDSLELINKDPVEQKHQLQTREKFLALAFDKYYSLEKNDSCNFEIAKNFYLKDAYFDTLWMDIKQLTVFDGKPYQYSDVNMILLQNAIDTINEKHIDEYLSEFFFKPLGLQTICYTPLNYSREWRIAPTENDKIWRKQLLHGYVHDPSAAFLCGISGNAGIFSNAHDLAILFQMLLNGGSYGGKQYLHPQTIELFTALQEDSERGLGFNKPAATSRLAESASDKSYGHTGFTGTCVWVDPGYELVYVFLSNRVYPNADNYELVHLKVREKIHEVFYEAAF